MATIEVKAAEGRIVRESPEGAFIPYDRYVVVELTYYMQRRIDEGDAIPRPPKAATPPKPVKPSAKADKKEDS
jgi:hypothetical protein